MPEAASPPPAKDADSSTDQKMEEKDDSTKQVETTTNEGDADVDMAETTVNDEKTETVAETTETVNDEKAETVEETENVDEEQSKDEQTTTNEAENEQQEEDEKFEDVEEDEDNLEISGDYGDVEEDAADQEKVDEKDNEAEQAESKDTEMKEQVDEDVPFDVDIAEPGTIVLIKNMTTAHLNNLLGFLTDAKLNAKGRLVVQFPQLHPTTKKPIGQLALLPEKMWIPQLDVMEAFVEEYEVDLTAISQEKEEEKKPEPATQPTVNGTPAPKVSAAPTPKKTAPPKPKPAPPKPKVEAEKDYVAPEDVGEMNSDTVEFSQYDCTLNTIKSGNGNIISPFQKDGMCNLMCGARLSHTIEKGHRLYFECKVIDTLQCNDFAKRANASKPFQVVLRIGLAGLHGGGEGLLIGGGTDSVGFSVYEGLMYDGNRKSQIPQLVPGKNDVIGLLYNRVKGHENENTISLFKNGVRITEPHKIRDDLLDTPLFPVISCKGVMVQANFNDDMQACKLPFKLPFIENLPASALIKNELDNERKTNKSFEALLPVGLPNQGYWDVVDELLKCGRHTEISTRKLVEWAEISGWNSPKLSGGAKGNTRIPANRLKAEDVADSIDPQPFGVKASLYKNQLLGLANLFRRNVIYADLINNFNFIGRQRVLDILYDKNVNIKMVVAVAENPPSAFHKRQEKMELERLKKLAKATGSNEVELPSNFKFRTVDTEVVPAVLEAHHEAWVAPWEKEGKNDRFTVEYKWGDDEGNDAKAHFRNWRIDFMIRKRVDGLKQSEEFKLMYDEFYQSRVEWRKKQKEHEDSLQKVQKDYEEELKRITKERADKVKYRNTKASQRKLLHKRKEREYQRLKAAAEKEGKEFDQEEPKIEPTPEAELEPLPELPKPPTVSNNDEFSNLDVWTVDDIHNAVDDIPIYADWSEEDWALLGLRYELHMLIHFFLKDTEGSKPAEERIRRGVHLDHLEHYYKSYYRNAFVPTQYGSPSMQKLVESLHDTLLLDENNHVIEPDHELATPIPIFVKLVEEARRIRNTLIEAGDESARLHFVKETVSSLRPNLQNKNSVGGNKQAPKTAAPPPQPHSSHQNATSKGKPVGNTTKSKNIGLVPNPPRSSGWGARLPSGRDYSNNNKRPYFGAPGGGDKRHRGGTSQYY